MNRRGALVACAAAALSMPAAVRAQAGLTLRHLSYHGQDGSYYVHVPPVTHGAAVFVLHGGLGNGSIVEHLTGFAAAADRGGFVTVYPNAGGQWNDGRQTTAHDWADVEFILAVARDVEARDHVDPKRLFVTGISNGGMMTLRLACDAAGSFAAFAAVAGNLPSALEPHCHPARPVPMMMFNGTADRFVPWAGGEVLHSARFGAGGLVISTTATVKFWRRADGCVGAGRSTAMPDVANDGTTVTRRVYDECRPGAQVVFYEIHGGGHTWPGSSARPRLRIAGITTRDIDATQIIVRFFDQYGL